MITPDSFKSLINYFFRKIEGTIQLNLQIQKMFTSQYIHFISVYVNSNTSIQIFPFKLCKAL